MMHKQVCGVKVQSVLNLVAYVLNLGITYGSLTGAFGETNTELSAKYHTLITPSGYAFSIWGLIFLGEGVFAVAQMFPKFSSSAVVDAVTPFWLSACTFQIGWTIFFAQELMLLALICMLAILVSLLGAILRADLLQEVSCAEYGLLRAPFSLHCGWIIAASALNINVLADFYKAAPEILLMLAILCLSAISVLVALFAFAVPKADPLIGLVACWALLAIFAELGNPEKLNDPARFNYFDWPELVLEALRDTALALGLASAAASAVAAGRRVCCHGAKSADAFASDQAI
ncbi:unnamed protein product [Effrenium voratum]|nr:unnamed protein product [Effrenium voratum]|mmetsp:Transcript_135755/g.321702  ORF Transcript_135755/g.321702 Transcript_135755/m.321702 type:complete len:289 (+) Transcript_135755:53-919(+)